MNKKEMTRKRIVDAAGKGIRQFGYGGIGVDGIAKEAGVTSGAFYGHFSSKANVFEETVATGINGLLEGVRSYQENKGDKWLGDFIDWYLGIEHRQDICNSCILPGLSAEVARAEQKVHMAYEGQLSDVIELIAAGLQNGSKQKRKKAAWSLLAILAGGVTMARAVDDESIATEIAKSVKQAAKQITEI